MSNVYDVFVTERQSLGLVGTHRVMSFNLNLYIEDSLLNWDETSEILLEYS